MVLARLVLLFSGVALAKGCGNLERECMQAEVCCLIHEEEFCFPKDWCDELDRFETKEAPEALLTASFNPSFNLAVASVPDYGNWCGAFNTKSDPTYPAKDGVDEVCRRHDLCLNNHNYHKCGCDHDFLRDLPSASCSNEHCEALRGLQSCRLRRFPIQTLRVSEESLCSGKVQDLALPWSWR